MKLRRNVLSQLQLNTQPALEAIGVSGAEEQQLLQELLQVRDSLFCHELQGSDPKPNAPTPDHNAPACSAIASAPGLLLSEYERDRRNSQLGRLFRSATHVHSMVDRIVVLSDNHCARAGRAFLDSCCQPFWNELSRAERGSKPRIYFSDGGMDNDHTQALLHLLESHKARPAIDEHDRWALVLIDSPVGFLESLPGLQHFLMALEVNSSRLGKQPQMLFYVSRERVSERSTESELPSFLKAQNILETFHIPQSLNDSCTALSMGGLISAASIGINVVELLQGASSMTKHFESAAAHENLVLRFAAFNLLFKKRSSLTVRHLCCWSRALTGFSSWLESLVSPKFSDANRSDLVHSIGTRFESWNEDVLLVPHVIYHHWIVDEFRFDDLGWNRAFARPGDATSGTSNSIRMHDTINRAFNLQLNHRIPFTTLKIPKADELHMGQLMQMTMLVAALERLYESNLARIPRE